MNQQDATNLVATVNRIYPSAMAIMYKMPSGEWRVQASIPVKWDTADEWMDFYFKQRKETVAEVEA